MLTHHSISPLIPGTHLVVKISQGEWSISKPLHLWIALGVSLSSSCPFDRRMFQSSSFNQDISLWDLSAGTMFTGMFEDATNFNQDLCLWGSNGYLSVGDDLTNAFAGTSCPSTDDPDLEASPIDPLCYVCDSTTPLPSAAPSSAPSPGLQGQCCLH